MHNLERYLVAMVFYIVISSEYATLCSCLLEAYGCDARRLVPMVIVHDGHRNCLFGLHISRLNEICSFSILFWHTCDPPVNLELKYHGSSSICT